MIAPTAAMRRAGPTQRCVFRLLVKQSVIGYVLQGRGVNPNTGAAQLGAPLGGGGGTPESLGPLDTRPFLHQSSQGCPCQPHAGAHRLTRPVPARPLPACVQCAALHTALDDLETGVHAHMGSGAVTAFRKPAAGGFFSANTPRQRAHTPPLPKQPLPCAQLAAPARKAATPLHHELAIGSLLWRQQLVRRCRWGARHPDGGEGGDGRQRPAGGRGGAPAAAGAAAGR